MHHNGRILRYGPIFINITSFYFISRKILKDNAIKQRKKTKLTTASTNGNVRGCSSIRPPATLNGIPSSIYKLGSVLNRTRIRWERKSIAREKKIKLLHVHTDFYQAINHFVRYVVEVNLLNKI